MTDYADENKFYEDMPMFYARSLEAPFKLRFIDGARLTLPQVNYYAALIHASNGDMTNAAHAFRRTHTLERRRCCWRKWHPRTEGTEVK